MNRVPNLIAVFEEIDAAVTGITIYADAAPVMVCRKHDAWQTKVIPPPEPTTVPRRTLLRPNGMCERGRKQV